MNTESILAEIDAEIARLQSARALLSNISTAPRKRGRRAKAVKSAAPKKLSKRRTMSPEAKERIRQAQIKRWAETKRVAKPNLNATVAPLPKAKKKAKTSAA